MSEDSKPIGSEPLPEEQPDERGSIQRAADDLKSIPKRSEATQLALTGLKKIGFTFGPEIIAFFLFFIALIAIIASLYLLICTGQSCQGTRPIDAINPSNNKQDALNLKDIICLNTAIEKNATTKDGKLPKSCVDPIQTRAKLIIANATAIKGKITEEEDGGKAAITILDDLIAAAKKAEAVKANMSIKEVQIIRDEITKQSELASNNALIQKQRGASPNAQKIIDYVVSKGIKATKQPGDSACRRTVDAVLRANFQNQGGWRSAGSASLGDILSTVAPTEPELQQARNVLAKGDIPVWQVHGDWGGKHFVAILAIDPTNNITFFDPAGGVILTRPSTWPGNNGTYKFFFGSPFDAAFTGTNTRERGYIFPASSMTPLANPGNPIVLPSSEDQ